MKLFKTFEMNNRALKYLYICEYTTTHVGTMKLFVVQKNLTHQ